MNRSVTTKKISSQTADGFRLFLEKKFKVENSELKDIWIKFALTLLDLLGKKTFLTLSYQGLAEFLWARFQTITTKKDASYQLNIVQDRAASKDPGFLKIFDDSTLIELVSDDRAFIIDSVYNVLDSYGLKIKVFVHPIFSLISKKGKIKDLELAHTASQKRISYVCCIIDQPTNFDWSDFQNKINNFLTQLQAITDDYQAVKKLCETHTIIHGDNSSESILEAEQRAIFHWYLQGNIILFGYGVISETKISETTKWRDIKKTLGWLNLIGQNKDTAVQKLVLESLAHFNSSNVKNSLMEITVKSLIHKEDNIILAMHKLHDHNRNSVVVIVPCVFTKHSAQESILKIPIVRLKLNGILDKLGLIENSHDYKDAVEFFGHFPRQELFRLDREELTYLYKQTNSIWSIDQLMVYAYSQPGRDYIRVTVILPLQKMSFMAVNSIAKEFKNYWGKEADYFYYFVSRYKQLSHIHFACFSDWEKIKEFDAEVWAKRLRNKLKSWQEALNDLIFHLPRQKKSSLLVRMADTEFPEDYKSIASPQEALEDLINIKKLLETNNDVITLDNKKDDFSKITIYSFNNYSLRNTFLKFDCLGLEPINSKRVELHILEQKVYVQVYLARHSKVDADNWESLSARFISFFSLSLSEKIGNEAIFELLFKTALDVRKIQLLKTYRNYLNLINPGFNQANLTRVLLDYYEFAEALVEYFEKKFLPKKTWHFDNSDHLKKEIQVLEEAIEKSKTIFEESALKSFLSIVQATVRTNFYVPGCETVAIKIDCSATEVILEPKPHYEIFMASEVLEGVHLRGSLISRGGIRHSDRADDYRTEVLGLMQTQMLKNAVIVPAGAKGGFIVKKLFSSRKEQLAELPEYYKDYISNLLSLTDNIIKDGEVVSPSNVVTYDDHDPYLVVAADKGTASYSDFANQISAAKGYWLNDAFASGGSNGYNHKLLGITARGAFECLKVHFKELGHNFKKDTFSVVGIGDMAGDVFGNGMLLSNKIKLVGAFNHLHIFLDPEPDPETSFTERKRLFSLGHSSWLDYNQDLISPGGGVFKRNSKAIPLNPALQKLFKTSCQSLSGIEIIRSLLTHKVDVIFNGGIGTYIKSSTETHEEVGDKSNSNVRVNATEIKAKIITEGGNLGITPLGRIEFSLNGGLINTDAVDNSAGVDMSDHEVNIKILLDLLINKKLLKNSHQRQKILAQLAGNVTDLCLLNNRQQSYLISLEQRRSKEDGNFYISEIEHLEVVSGLIRTNDFIPDDQWLVELIKKGQALPRPVLAILISHIKNYVYDRILASDISDDPEMNKYFINYFPKSLTEKFDLSRIEHPLRREIICLTLVNFFVNQNGLIFLPAVHTITSNKVVDIIKSFLAVSALFPENGLRDKILDNCPTDNFNVACRLVMDLNDIVKERTVWMLANFLPHELNLRNLSGFQQHLNEFLAQPDSMKYTSRALYQQKKQQLLDLGYHEEIATDYAKQVSLNNPLSITLLRQTSGLDFSDIQTLISNIENHFNFNAIETLLFETMGKDEWEKAFVGSLILKTNLIKKNYYDVLCSYIGVHGTKDAFANFIADQESLFEKYRKDWFKFYYNKKSHLSAISVLLDKLDRYLQPPLD